MIYSKKPSDFKNKFTIVACFCIKDDTLLLLHRQNNKPQGDTWGVPAGKVDENEGYLEAMQRELKEETGLIVPLNKLTYLNKVYTRYPDYDFTFYMYRTTIEESVKITINSSEHKDFIWVSYKDLHRLTLMEDLAECIKIYCRL